jgi:hypothetical protein
MKTDHRAIDGNGGCASRNRISWAFAGAKYGPVQRHSKSGPPVTMAYASVPAGSGPSRRSRPLQVPEQQASGRQHIVKRLRIAYDRNTTELQRTTLKIFLFFFLTASAYAAKTPWPVLRVGQRVEIDSACSGTWLRATIVTEDPDKYSKTATRYSVKYDDGHEWVFSGPGIVAPCIRPLGASVSTPVAPVAAGSGPFQGLYLQLQAIGTAYSRVHYYFWHDGRFCKGLPSGGIDREPAEFAVVQRQETCGQYRVDGSSMSLLWQGDSKPYSVTLRNVRAESFEMNGYATVKMAAFAPGQRLNAAYTATVVGTHTRKQTYSFHQDGTYLLNDEPVTSSDGPPRSQAGSYRLIMNTLELTGTGAERLTAYPFPGGGILIDNTVFSTR